MTESEAIRDLQYLIGEYSAYPPETGVNETIGSLQYCISALKEIQQYREIGTVEECREAVEKQKPKKIIIRDWNPTKCPTCGHELSTSLGDGYYKHPTFLKRCPKCGQMIRWSEDLEGMEDE